MKVDEVSRVGVDARRELLEVSRVGVEPRTAVLFWRLKGDSRPELKRGRVGVDCKD